MYIQIRFEVYRKAINTGLFSHFKSHTDKRHKVGFLKTMLYRAYALSSETGALNAECDKLRSIFSRLNYPRSLIESIIFIFSLGDSSGPSANVAERDNSMIRIRLPFKDKVSANAFRRHLSDDRYKFGPTVQPVFVSRKLEQDLSEGHPTNHFGKISVRPDVRSPKMFGNFLQGKEHIVLNCG